jgi:NAD(P)-dependent dehydrogenase (short-subunit alcohol dehydrogenase family)
MAGLFDLEGKVVLVTGGNSGLGLGFARGCARQGADLVIWGRNLEKNHSAEAELTALGAGRVFSDGVDVRDESAVSAGMARTIERAGRIDCVFANAGIASVAPSFPDMTSEMYHELMATNLHGAFYTLREVARHMRARAQAGDPGGSIVVCGSLSIFAGRQGLQHYGAAKGALASMVKGLATELGQFGVRANMIAPGAIRTGFTEGPNRETMEKRVASITPLGRVGQIDDIQGLAVYFASDASSFHTGDIVVLDGGRLANTP